MPKRLHPRAPTLTLPPELRPQLVISGNRYSLRNLSLGGLGVWAPEASRTRFQIGALHDGMLELLGASYLVRVEVRFQHARVVGLKLIEPSQELLRLLETLLEPACLAGALSARGVPGEEDPVNGYCRLWYAGQSGAELLVWYNPASRMIVAIQITWRTHVVFRHHGRGIETGELHDEPLRAEGRVHLAEAYRLRHPVADEVIVRQAAQFLAAVERHLSGPLLWQFLETGEQVYLPASPDVRSDVA